MSFLNINGLFVNFSLKFDGFSITGSFDGFFETKKIRNILKYDFIF